MRVRALLLWVAAVACEVTGPPNTVRIAWSINGDAKAVGCPTLDTCEEVAARAVRGRFLDEAGGALYEYSWDCGPNYWVALHDVAVGEHQIGVALVDASGSVLTQEHLSDVVVVGQAGADLCVDFAAGSFLTPQTGVFRFALTWGKEAQGCAAAGVARIVVDGRESLCTDAEQALPKRPWGAAIVDVAGLDKQGSVLVEATCHVMVGAMENPVVALSVTAEGCQ